MNLIYTIIATRSIESTDLYRRLAPGPTDNWRHSDNFWKTEALKAVQWERVRVASKVLRSVPDALNDLKTADLDQLMALGLYIRVPIRTDCQLPLTLGQATDQELTVLGYPTHREQIEAHTRYCESNDFPAGVEAQDIHTNVIGLRARLDGTDFEIALLVKEHVPTMPKDEAGYSRGRYADWALQIDPEVVY